MRERYVLYYGYLYSIICFLHPIVGSKGIQGTPS